MLTWSDNHKDGFWAVLDDVISSHASLSDPGTMCSAIVCLNASGLLEDLNDSSTFCGQYVQTQTRYREFQYGRSLPTKRFQQSGYYVL